MIAYADLIAAFPEFANSAAYPVSQINFWIPQAYATLDAARLGTALDLAAMLFVAHNIVLSAQAAKAVAGGAVAGAAGGVVASKSVDALSVSYDTKLTATADAGIFNATSYGQRLYKLLQGKAAGGIYVPAQRPFGYPVGVWSRPY